jgi:hypothetical protein
VFLSAITVTLWMHDGHPLPNWPRSITVNTLISLFSTLLEAAMMVPVAEGMRTILLHDIELNLRIFAGIGQLKWLWYSKSRSVGDMNQFDVASRGAWGAGMLILARRGLFVSNDLLISTPLMRSIEVLHPLDPSSPSRLWQSVHSCSKYYTINLTTFP